MYHPSYILNSQRGRQIRGKDFDKDSIESLVFNRDLDHALSHLEKPFPRMTVPEVRYPKWPLDLMYLLRFEKNLWAIDYETSGLKPYARGHRIASVGVAWNDGCAAFPLTSRRAMREWKICLFSKAIGKIAHNMKFEHQWAAHCLGVETENWKWDTMQAAHILDNRQGITSLKRQAYLTLGVDDWSTEDFDSDSEGFNSLRRDEPTEALLRYNALDAWYTMQLYKIQRTQFK